MDIEVKQLSVTFPSPMGSGISCITFTMRVSIMRNSVLCRSLITSRLMMLPLC